MNVKWTMGTVTKCVTTLLEALCAIVGQALLCNLMGSRVEILTSALSIRVFAVQETHVTILRADTSARVGLGTSLQSTGDLALTWTSVKKIQSFVTMASVATLLAHLNASVAMDMSWLKGLPLVLMWTSVKSILLNVVTVHTVPILLEATFVTVNQDTLESGTSAMILMNALQALPSVTRRPRASIPQAPLTVFASQVTQGMAQPAAI